MNHDIDRVLGLLAKRNKLQEFVEAHADKFSRPRQIKSDADRLESGSIEAGVDKVLREHWNEARLMLAEVKRQLRELGIEEGQS